MVQLGEQATEFASLNTEIIVVFREEDQEVDGLKKTKDKTKTPYTLAFDNNKESSASYSPKKMTFDNYVIDKSGNLKAIIPGTLTVRAKAKQLMKHLKEIESQ